jgi:hypothetical protein
MGAGLIDLCNTNKATKRRMKRKNIIDPYKIVGVHPVTNEPVDLKWYIGASRYNNGATLYGKKYLLRLLLARNKENQTRLGLSGI